MARIQLISTPYAGKSNIASGQECINLYAEINATLDPQAPSQTTYYPTPGSIVYSDPGFVKKARGCYRTSIGTAYYVVGPNVYFLLSNQTLVQIGTIGDNPSQVYMIDNGLVVILVDGTAGYVIDINSNTMAQIIDPNFYPADFVALLDTFFIFNRSKTNQFFISESNASYGDLTNSSIATITLANAGSGLVNGIYNNVALTGGSGTGATADITVAGNVTTIFDIGNPGQGFIIGDVLNVPIGEIGGSGTPPNAIVDTIGSAFNALDIAAKSGFNDPIVGILSVHRELWLIGNRTTEVWVGTGAADFYFQEQQGAYINHGCAAQYSIATMDVLTFFLMEDQQGNGLVVQGQGYDVTEISTPRLISIFKEYATITDAIGFCFQIGDHAFYALIFPTANKGWLYDVGTKQWNEWNWVDNNGNLNRPRANCFMFAFDTTLVGDWENGQLLELSLDIYLDVGQPITCIRTFPHQVGTPGSNAFAAKVDSNERITYLGFQADMQVGTAAPGDNPQVSLSWSDDKGVSYGNPVSQPLGMIGQTLTAPMWNRLGQARDRVFKLSWAANCKTSLNGGFIDLKGART